MTGQIEASSGLRLLLSEDAYLGDAQFTVAVDGVQIGGVNTVTASHSAGQSQPFLVPGSYIGAHTVSVTFLNDAWGGDSTKDRNLYIDAIDLDGAVLQTKAELGGNGSLSYHVQPPPVLTIQSSPIAANGLLHLTGSLNAASGTKVYIYNGTSVLGMGTVNQDGTWNFNTALSAGSYSLHATAEDPRGYFGTAVLTASVKVAESGSPTIAHPFDASSAWNVAIGASAQYQSANGAQTSSLRTGANPWIAANAMGIYQATNADPLATWSYQNSEHIASRSGAGTTQLRTPESTQFMTNDGWAVIVSPDKQSYYETWLGSKGSQPATYNATYLVENTISGTGFGTSSDPSQGIRAAGASILGGLVRAQELNDLNIPHALAMAIAPTQAAAGQTTTSQYVYPATAADEYSLQNYSGTIPIGSHFAIPQDVDLTTIGIKTPEGLALARAYQTYGGYVVDTALATDSLAFVETGATAHQISDLMSDVATIRANLNLVTSNGPLSYGPPAIAISSQALASDTGLSATDNITQNGSVKLSGTLYASPNTTVTVYDGATDLGKAVVSGTSWTYSTTLGAGTHRLYATAVDSSGRSVSTPAGAAVQVLTQAPIVSITEPSSDIRSDGVVISGKVKASGTASVTLYDGTSAIGTATGEDDGTWSVAATLTPGKHTLSAVATDLAGNSGTSAALALNVPPTQPDTLTIEASEDAYLGDAQFILSFDGRQVGGVQKVTALHNSDQTQTFTFQGAFGSGPHKIGINFINDSYGGSPMADRNLYIKSISLDSAVDSLDAKQGSGGLATYSFRQDGPSVQPAATNAGSTSLQAFTLKLSEDAFMGDAHFTVAVDGKQVGGVECVTALHKAGQTADFTFLASTGQGSHDVGVSFLDDAYGGAPSLDRNLYVDGISVGGQSRAFGQLISNNGDYHFQVMSGATNVSPASLHTVASGATLIADQSDKGDFSFSGSVGELQLSPMRSLSGSIEGFRGQDTLDFRSIAFSAETAKSLVLQKSAPQPVLCLSDGVHSASLSMIGLASNSSLVAVADACGGTLVKFV